MHFGPAVWGWVKRSKTAHGPNHRNNANTGVLVLGWSTLEAGDWLNTAMYGTVRAHIWKKHCKYQHSQGTAQIAVLRTINAFYTKQVLNTINYCLKRRKMPQHIVKYMVSSARIAKVFKHTSQIYWSCFEAHIGTRRNSLENWRERILTAFCHVLWMNSCLFASSQSRKAVRF